MKRRDFIGKTGIGLAAGVAAATAWPSSSWPGPQARAGPGRPLGA